MLKNLFSRLKSAEKQKVVVVSGLPRSGTSMMMQMLAKGGLSIVTDALRKADVDNPKGYYEIEQSKKLKDGDTRWLYEAQGRAVKVISYLLEYLPDDLAYDVIFMQRKIPEILASQRKMLQHRNEASSITDDEMAQQFQEHLKAVKYWIARKPNMRVLYVDYNDVVNEPEPLCTTLVEFLELPLDLKSMQAVPLRSLYRNRA